jgi:hypothetical protein
MKSWKSSLSRVLVIGIALWGTVAFAGDTHDSQSCPEFKSFHYGSFVYTLDESTLSMAVDGWVDTFGRTNPTYGSRVHYACYRYTDASDCISNLKDLKNGYEKGLAQLSGPKNAAQRRLFSCAAAKVSDFLSKVEKSNGTDLVMPPAPAYCRDYHDKVKFAVPLKKGGKAPLWDNVTIDLSAPGNSLNMQFGHDIGFTFDDVALRSTNQRDMFDVSPLRERCDGGASDEDRQECLARLSGAAHYLSWARDYASHPDFARAAECALRRVAEFDVQVLGPTGSRAHMAATQGSSSSPVASPSGASRLLPHVSGNSAL